MLAGHLCFTARSSGDSTTGNLAFASAGRGAALRRRVAVRIVWARDTLEPLPDCYVKLTAGRHKAKTKIARGGYEVSVFDWVGSLEVEEGVGELCCQLKSYIAGKNMKDVGSRLIAQVCDVIARHGGSCAHHASLHLAPMPRVCVIVWCVCVRACLRACVRACVRAFCERRVGNQKSVSQAKTHGSERASNQASMTSCTKQVTSTQAPQGTQPMRTNKQHSPHT
jgi:hypothetical protein